MKFVVCFLSLIAVSLAQDHSCKIKFPQSYLMKANFAGSSYNSDNKSDYKAFVGNYTQATNNTGNPATSMIATLESIVFNNGTTGEQISSEWISSLTVGSSVYILVKIDGKLQPCQKFEGFHFRSLSDAFRSLKTVFPIPGVPFDPEDACICKGGISEKQGATDDMIMSVDYFERKNETMDKLTYLSELTKSMHLMVEVTSVVELPANSTKAFNNPCKHTEVSAARDIPEGYHGYVRRFMHKGY